MARKRLSQQQGGDERTRVHDEHDGVAHLSAGIELLERLQQGGTQQLAIEQCQWFARHDVNVLRRA